MFSNKYLVIYISFSAKVNRYSSERGKVNIDPPEKGSQSSHHPVTIETKLGKEHQNQKKEEVKIYGDAQVKLQHSWFDVSLFMWFIRKIK